MHEDGYSTLIPKKSMNNKRYKKLGSMVLTILLGLLLVYAGYQKSQDSNTQTGNGKTYYHAKVTKVVDGDTAEIVLNGQTKKVRYIGMDTPEVVDPRKTVQCFGKEASNKAHELLDGQDVTVVQDNLVGEQDKYGRILAYIYLPDGKLYNQLMIAQGFAHEYTYQNQAYTFQQEFKQAQQQAIDSQSGLWSPTTCSGDTLKPA